MNALIVAAKEILDNLRDRQTLFYALLFGPVLLPLLLGGSLAASFRQLAIDFEEVTELAVAGTEHAPNLLAFLRANNVDAVDAPEAFEDAVRHGELPLALEIDERYGRALREGRPAPLTLHVDEGEQDSAKLARRVRALLELHERKLDALRLQHRGIDPTLFDSLEVIVNDVSRDGERGRLLASLLPFLLIVSMTMGGFYLAIDTTAGERERRSLEPLLTLPLGRRVLVLGKFGATLAFVTLSAVLAAVCVWLLFRLFPTELLGGRVRFDARTVFGALALVAPLAPLVAAALVTIAAWTRSTKEAQAYLGLLMVLPMAPFFALQFLSLSAEGATLALPVLGQYLLLERHVLGDVLPAGWVVASALATLACAAALLGLACRLYESERILG